MVCSQNSHPSDHTAGFIWFAGVLELERCASLALILKATGVDACGVGRSEWKLSRAGSVGSCEACNAQVICTCQQHQRNVPTRRLPCVVLCKELSEQQVISEKLLSACSL